MVPSARFQPHRRRTRYMYMKLQSVTVPSTSWTMHAVSSLCLLVLLISPSWASATTKETEAPTSYQERHRNEILPQELSVDALESSSSAISISPMSLQDPDCDHSSSKYDPLACWLWNIKVSIPDQEFEKYLITVKVSDLTCTNFVVEGLESNYNPSDKNSTDPTKQNPSIPIKVKGMSVYCQGHYHATPAFSGDLEIRAFSDGDDNTGLQFTFEILSSMHAPPKNTTTPIQQEQNQSQYWMPDALNTKQCTASLKVTDLKFHGSISADIVNWFSGMISRKVSSELNDEVLCPQLKDAVDPIITQTIKEADQILIKYLHVPHNKSSNGYNNNSHSHNGIITATTPVTHDPMQNGHTMTSRNRTQPTLLLMPQTTRKLQSTLSSGSPLPYMQPIIVRESSAAASSAPVVDFANDTPLLFKAIQHLNNFLGCFYNSGTAQNCESLINKGLKGLADTVVDGMADQITIPIPQFMHHIRFDLPQYGKVLVDVQELHVVGLDELQSLSLLSPVNGEGGPLTHLKTQLQSNGGVNITANVNITVSPIPGGLIHGDSLNEVFHVNFNMSTVNAIAMVHLALDKGKFERIQMGHILDAFFPDDDDKKGNATKVRKCLLETIQTLHVDDMTLRAVLRSATFVPHFDASNFGQGRRVSALISRKLEEDLDDVLNHFLTLTLQEYQPLLTDSAFGLVQTTLLSLVNGWLDRKVNNHTNTDTVAVMVPPFYQHSAEEEALCPRQDKSTNQILANFSRVPLLGNLNKFINQPSSLDSINQAIESIAEKLEARFNPSMLKQVVVTGLVGVSKGIPGVSLKLKELRLDNFGSVEHIDLLSPQIDGLHLKHGISYAVKRGTPRLHLALDLDYRPRNLNAILNLTTSLADVYLDAGSILHFDMTRLRQLALSQLLSNGHCVVTPFRKHQLYNNDSGSQIGILLANVSAEVTGGARFENFTVSTDTTAYPSAASLVSAIVAWVLYTVQDALNTAAYSSFGQAEGYCTGGEVFGYDEDPPKLNDGFQDELFLPVLGVFVALFVVAQALYFCGKRYCRRHVAGDNDSHDATGQMSQALLSQTNNGTANDSVPEEEKEGNESKGETLLQSEVISAFSRQAVPISIVGTIVLLLSSNISSGATVDVYLTWKERSLALPALFTFSLINTAKDMWEAGIYPLFFLVLILSGMWPYAKLILMFVSWITPTSYLKPSTRGRLLLALDALGKFALVDTYLFVLFMVAFRYHLDVSDSLSMDVFVSPETGFYTFLVATCFSLLMGHFMVYSHRLSEMRNLKPRNARRIRNAVLSHKFELGNNSEGDGQQMRLTRGFGAVLVLFAAAATVLLSVGITRKCFKFEIGGVAGDLLGNDRITYYSLVSLGKSLRKSVKEPSSIGILLLEVIYFFYAVATPFACLLLLVVLFLVPMTLETQRFVLVLAEISNAWSAVEVFVISIIASLLEISTFASFIVGHRCDLIKKVIAEHFTSALDDATDATCFTVRSSVESSAWVLILGALINSMVVGVMLRLIHCSVNERIEAEMQSSQEPIVNDALRTDDSSRPRTIINLLSCGCWRCLFFDVRSATVRTMGFMPQSDDTYSVRREVNWEEESTVNTMVNTTDVRPHPSPGQDVMETLRDAFD